VVSFFKLFEDNKKWQKTIESNEKLFDTGYVKKTFNCDAYTYQLNEYVLEYISYYLTLFSHQRKTESWKGIVQLEFSENSEIQAERILQERGRQWL